MPQFEHLPDLNFLSELYAQDSPSAQLLAEYPSSNSFDTRFQNKNRFIIHDPFPPPPKSLIKVLGPHHLMCCWGDKLAVTSDVPPPQVLLDHWTHIFGKSGLLDWKPYDGSSEYITLFPHESIPAERQVIDPEVNYELHSKEVIEQIDCRQANVLPTIEPPCIVKLSHGYAGLGNYLIDDEQSFDEMKREVAEHWPSATLVANSIIENIVGDYGVQFYLRKNGQVIWLGFTAQRFDENSRWCGGIYSAKSQIELEAELSEMVEPAAKYLHSRGYFGLAGIDILNDKDGQLYLVDVNPRLTGVSPFLMASRMFLRDGLDEGIYQASCRFRGSYEQLVEKVESNDEGRALVLSAIEDKTDQGELVTICHLSVSSKSQNTNQKVLNDILN